MGIGSRVVASFIAVIAIMVLGYSSYSIFTDYRESRLEANQRASTAMSKVRRDVTALKAACSKFAEDILRDSSIMSAFQRSDKKTVASGLARALNSSRFPGFVTLIKPDGKVFFSTETPKLAGYSAREKSQAVDGVFRDGRPYSGASDFSATQEVTISSIVPILDKKKKMLGVLAVSQPINKAYLTGEVTRFGLEDLDPVRDIDLLVYSSASKSILHATEGVANAKGGGFIKEINKLGSKAFTGSTLGLGFRPLELLIVPIDGKSAEHSFERSNRWWFEDSLRGNPDPKTGKQLIYGHIIVSTSVPPILGRILIVLIGTGVFGALALLISFALSARISRSVSEPMDFLLDRTADIADKKAVIPPLEGLSGDWLELGELIDTAVSTMRHTTQNLKLKLNNQKEELVQRNQQLEDSTAKLENLNKQISTQSRQLTEVSKQINQANRQAIVVQHKLDAVLQSSSEAFLILDQYGNILTANPIFLTWTGASEGEIAGRQCFDLVRRPGQTRLRTLAGQAFAQHGGDPNAVLDRFHPEGIVFHKNEDKSIEVIAHLQPIVGEDNSVQGYVMVLRDKSLRTENTQLREEIVTMLNDAIRGPLAQGENYWSGMLSNSSALHPQTVASLHELHDIYQKLVAVVDSYLMMYGGFVPEPIVPKEQIVISQLISNCIQEVVPHARQRQLLVEHKTVTGLPSINGNREAVKDALIQSLNKLISVTAAGGRVRVESAMREGQMKISITSSGPSLPAEEIIDMFAGFIEGKHAQESYAQRLSLYLARNNIERSGGQIWAETEAGRGTAIHFTLPGK